MNIYEISSKFCEHQISIHFHANSKTYLNWKDKHLQNCLLWLSKLVLYANAFSNCQWNGGIHHGSVLHTTREEWFGTFR